MNLMMQREHISLIERKLKTQTRRLVKHKNGHQLSCQYKANRRYWVCPPAKWKLGDKFYQNLEQLRKQLGEEKVNRLIETNELKRCRQALGVFKVRTIPNNETGTGFRKENLLSISPEDAVREGSEDIESYLKVFYKIYAKQRKPEAEKSLKLLQKKTEPFEAWFKNNRKKLWNPVVRVIDFKFLPNTGRDNR